MRELAVFMFSLLAVSTPFVRSESILNEYYVEDFDNNEALIIPEHTKHNLVSTYYHYCYEHTPVCNVTLSPLNNPYIRHPVDTFGACCANCVCGDHCDDADRCCPERVIFGKEFQNRPRQRCHSTHQKVGKIDFFTPSSFLMIDRCDPRWANMALNDRSKSIIAAKCERSRDYSDIYTRIPVSTLFLGDTFVNRYCAECNFEKLYVEWTPAIGCSDDKFDNQIDPRQLLSAIDEAESCNFGTIRPREYDFKPIPCHESVSECNLTGLWDVYDPYIENACDTINIPYQFIYRNVYCFICNSNDEQSTPRCFPSVTTLLTFELILRPFKNGDEFIPDTRSNTKDDVLCLGDQLYDPLQKTCIKIKCLLYKTFHNNSCINTIDRVSGICYEAFLKMTPINRIRYSSQTVNNIVYKALSPILGDLVDSIFVSVRLAAVENDVSQTNIKYILTHIIICFEVYQGPKPIDIIDYILSLHNTTIGSQPDSKVFLELDFFPYSVKETIDISLIFTVTYTDYNDNVTFKGDFTYFQARTHRQNWEILLPLHACPTVEVDSSFYNISFNFSGIYIEELEIELKLNEFIIHENNSTNNSMHVVVCKDKIASAFQNLQLDPNPNRPQTNTWFPFFSSEFKGILSLICSSVSIFCSVLTVLCCACIKDIQTQPCINNLCLAVSLVCAQSLFQFGAGQFLHVPKWACQTIGILTHYFWLVTILWMNVCSVHMYKVFSNALKTSNRTGFGRRTFLYWVYCLFTAAPPVLTNIVTSLIKSGQQSIGYGERLCYISDNEMVGYCFVVPVALIIVCNMLLFVVTALKIKSAHESRYFKSDRNLLVIYAKLSTLTGITWVFGFLSIIFDEVDVFGYLFIVLNAGQGILLFISFICNRRVMNCLKIAVIAFFSCGISDNGAT